MDSKHLRIMAAAGIGLGALVVGATTVAAQNSPDETHDTEDSNEGTDVPITGSDLDQASAVALDFTGEGRVTDTEVGDEESYYEVEVTLDNGSELDVQLDEGFNVVDTD